MTGVSRYIKKYRVCWVRASASLGSDARKDQHTPATHPYIVCSQNNRKQSGNSYVINSKTMMLCDCNFF